MSNQIIVKGTRKEYYLTNLVKRVKAVVKKVCHEM